MVGTNLSRWLFRIQPGQPVKLYMKGVAWASLPRLPRRGLEVGCKVMTLGLGGEERLAVIETVERDKAVAGDDNIWFYLSYQYGEWWQYMMCVKSAAKAFAASAEALR